MPLNSKIDAEAVLARVLKGGPDASAGCLVKVGWLLAACAGSWRTESGRSTGRAFEFKNGSRWFNRP